MVGMTDGGKRYGVSRNRRNEMKLILKFLITVIVLLGINTTQIFAEDNITQELQSFDQKIATIEAQIDGLKSKGLKNLSNEERIEYGSLKKELLKIQKELVRSKEL